MNAGDLRLILRELQMRALKAGYVEKIRSEKFKMMMEVMTKSIQDATSSKNPQEALPKIVGSLTGTLAGFLSHMDAMLEIQTSVVLKVMDVLMEHRSEAEQTNAWEKIRSIKLDDLV